MKLVRDKMRGFDWDAIETIKQRKNEERGTSRRK